MTQEDEKYYELYFDLFVHPGWEQFTNEIKDILDSYKIEDIKNETNLAFIKGERSTLRRVVQFADSIKRAYEINTERDNA